MQDTTTEYRGFHITVTPVKNRDQDGLWDFAYRLERIGAGSAAPVAQRARTVGGYLSDEVARNAGVEVARTEVDNLLALAQDGGAAPSPAGAAPPSSAASSASTPPARSS